MTGIWRIFRYEIVRQAKRRSYQFITFGVPIIAIAIFFGLRAYSDARQAEAEQSGQPQTPQIAEDSPLRDVLPLGYVDESGLLKPSTYTNLVAFESQEAAQQAVADGVISAYYVVESDYLSTGDVRMVVNRPGLDNLDSGALRMLIIDSLKEKLPDAIDPRVIMVLQARQFGVENHTLSDAGEVQVKNDDAAMGLVYVFVLVLLLSTFTTSGYLMQSVVEEKENRMVEVLLSSIRPRDLLFGKYFALSVLGLLQMVAWGAALLFILSQLGQLDPNLIGLGVTPNQVAVMAIYYVLGFLLFGAAYAAIGALVTNMREGPQYVTMITLPAVLPVYAMPAVAAAPNSALAVALSIFPITAPIGMVMRAALVEVPFIELAISITLLSLTVIGFIWLAARFFRVNVLLSGQMPKARDLLRLVRERV
ncbi:MAG: ABC transporter permease [Anaerolineae bacterium]|nr:ABC transporter permease [Anaerolineae bacterium]